MNILFLLLTIISLLGAPIFLILALFNLIRKKPAKKRFKWAGISALVFISSLVGFGFTMEPPAIPESIELSIPDYQAEYDINTEIPLSITVFPEKRLYEPEDTENGLLHYPLDDGRNLNIVCEWLEDNNCKYEELMVQNETIGGK